MDDEAMFVRTESLPRDSHHLRVRVYTPIGSAVVLWHGDPREADGRHLVEWTVDEDIRWGRNARSAVAAEPELRQDGDRVNLRGRHHTTDDGAAWLQLGHWSVLLDLAAPVPGGLDGSWVRIDVASENVTLYPYQV
ncbi:hypothetical protein [Streptomyces sp. NPDC047024]|uniref:hypothetical protein n=1 Tax=Streptomyces sp. NPDC047024 TaxID=3155476 RepID=UPI0033E5D1BB